MTAGQRESKTSPGGKTVSLKAGQKGSFCTCGQSSTLPYCDDTHKKINVERGTSYRPLKIWPKEDVELEVYCGNWEKEA